MQSDCEPITGGSFHIKRREGSRSWIVVRPDDARPRFEGTKEQAIAKGIDFLRRSGGGVIRTLNAFDAVVEEMQISHMGRVLALRTGRERTCRPTEGRAVRGADSPRRIFRRLGSGRRGFLRGRRAPESED